ncbi:gsl1852 [Gloeobacter violaceus PCC 7421]|uniref:Gsl1852 protein n=1 Tax=Gloeobacter violaceus (strain ATCC 29082 / PCC 7421) TaxID=251221 RepID=Q7NJI0_GLOVI|nr:gsl1852 [Gloeobacter violaceus PCC 7421]
MARRSGAMLHPHPSTGRPATQGSHRFPLRFGESARPPYTHQGFIEAFRLCGDAWIFLGRRR